MPLHDEEAGVEALGKRLRELLARDVGRDLEIVLVDDGSTDRTPELLAALAASLPARLVRHDVNRGLTAALWTGSRLARGDYVGWLDSDLTYDPGILVDLAQALDEGADVALASCHHPRGRVEGVGPLRLWLSRFASGAYRLATGTSLHTFTCMVRVQRREILARCRPLRGGYAGVTEALLRALRAGAAIVERPAVLRRRREGRSKMRVLHVGFSHLGLMAAYRLGRLDEESLPRPAR